MERPVGTITYDTAPLDGLLERLREAGADPRQALEEIGGVLEGNLRHHFEEGKGPGGEPWKQSWRARIFGGQTLLETGVHLRDTATHEVQDGSVVWGLTSSIAKIHQYGGTIVPKKPGGRLVFGALESEEDAEGNVESPLTFAQKVVMPARPMVGFDDRDLGDTRDVLVDHFVRIAHGDPDLVFA